MLLSSALGTTLLWTPRSRLPQTFRRYKSLTAAIERGKHDGPGRPFRPRTRTPPEDGDGARPRSRADLRLQRFGPPSDRRVSTLKPRERPYASRSWQASEEQSPRNRDDYSQRRGGRVEAPFERRVRSNNRFDESTRRLERRDTSVYRTDDRPPRRDRDGYSQRVERLPRREGRRFEGGERRPFDRDDKFKGSQDSSTDRTHGNRTAARDTSSRPQRGPEVLPYSTAASEFIYGYSSVIAAIKANRRKLYNLYVHSRGASRDQLMAQIRAAKLFPITQKVGDEYLRAMDKASSGRPHNGVILEASPLPVPPITELKEASREDESFRVTVDSQSAEDALVNGKQETYRYKSAGWRHPLILYVDGVLIEGNLGAIARSAYFLGVDAIVTCTRQTAPWSHIALKASAGAAEAIPLFKVGDPAGFLGKSSRAGWRIYASDAMPTGPATSGGKEEVRSNIVYTIARSTKQLPAGHCPVAEHATILMMGAEDTGLRGSLLSLAHYKMGIRHGRDVDQIGVDSLNVSVAASILFHEMLQKPMAKQTTTTSSTAIF